MILKNSKNGASAGFTLIELLVVIAIIAILAGILFPVFVSAKAAARRSACMDNMRQLGTAMTQYRNDWQGWFPTGGSKNIVDAGSSDMSGEWQNVTFRYVRNEQLYRCPGTACPPVDMKNPLDLGRNLALPRSAITYLFNSQLATDMRGGAAAATLGMPKPHNDSEVVSTSKCVMIMEGNKTTENNAGWAGNVYTGKDGLGRTKSMWLGDYIFYMGTASLTGGEDNGSCGLPHHSDGGNLLFVDGHVVYKKYHNCATLQGVLPYGRYCVPSGTDLRVWKKSDS